MISFAHWLTKKTAGKAIWVRVSEAGAYDEWLANYSAIFGDTERVMTIPCPSCERRELNLVMVLRSEGDRQGWGAFWGGRCLTGIAVCRAEVAAGVSTLVGDRSGSLGGYPKLRADAASGLISEFGQERPRGCGALACRRVGGPGRLQQHRSSWDVFPGRNDIRWATRWL
jgi:hypothetical protein